MLTSGEAEIPELMAKASVIYNPIVYTIMHGTTGGTCSARVFCPVMLCGQIIDQIRILGIGLGLA